MKYKIRKIGGSLAVTIPPYIREVLDFKEGDNIDINIHKKYMLIKKEVN